MGIMPPDNVTIAIDGVTGTITGNMSAWTVAPGMVLHPGYNGGPQGLGLEIAAYVQNGTTGATVTFAKPSPTAYSAGTKFYIAAGPAAGSNSFVVNQLQRIISYFGGIFGQDLSIDTNSQQVPLRRAAGLGYFARFAFLIRSGSSDILAFFLSQRTMADGREVLLVQASPDGAGLVDAMEVNRQTGGVMIRRAEEVVASDATVDLGAVRSNRVAITGTTQITSFGSVPHQYKIVRFPSGLTLVNGVGLDLHNGGLNLVMTANDIAAFASDASGNWALLWHRPQRAGGSGILVSSHLLTAPDSAPRGFSSGDTSVVDGVNRGMHWITGLRENLPYGVQLGISDTTDSVFVRRFSANAWQAWRRIAEFGSGVVAKFGRVNVGSAIDLPYSVIVQGDRALNVRTDIGNFGFPNLGLVLQAALADQTSATNLYLSGSNVHFGAPFLPTFDNAYAIGSASLRPTQIFAATGTIGTSDARLKTEVRVFTAEEIAWGRALGREIGIYQFLAAIEEKGASHARLHVGMTVQRAIELGYEAGIADPFRYGFICHDRWEATSGQDAIAAVPAKPAVHDAEGYEIEPAVPWRDAIPAVPPRPAGDLYSFREGQLGAFIGATQEQRLAALEAAIAA